MASGKTVYILCKTDILIARNRYVPDISKVQQDLGLSVTVLLTEAIRRMSVLK